MGGFVQKPIEFLTVMHARVGHVILPDQLVPGIGMRERRQRPKSGN